MISKTRLNYSSNRFPLIITRLHHILQICPLGHRCLPHIWWLPPQMSCNLQCSLRAQEETDRIMSPSLLSLKSRNLLTRNQQWSSRVCSCRVEWNSSKRSLQKKVRLQYLLNLLNSNFPQKIKELLERHPCNRSRWLSCIQGLI